MNLHALPRNFATSVAFASSLICSLTAPARADQVIADDLVVQGSGAFGFDAILNENFGADTIRLKENNLRIHFDDTSAGTFPGNDWRLIANDQANGGGNYFAIEDSTAARIPFRVDAGAPADALRIVSSGHIGIGTSAPGLHMEILKGNTPAVRLAQDGSAGWGAQTWDVAGNEANFFIRDATGSKLPFRIRPGAPTSSIDVAASGNVGIGTESPKAKLHVAGTGYLEGNVGIGVEVPTAKLHVAGNALVTGTLEIGSSRAIKDGIKDLDLEEARKAFLALKPVHFKYKTESEQQLGFIAEDVPDLVATDSRRSLVTMDFVAVLTKVVQQHDKQVRELENAIAAKDAAIQAIAARLDILERGATARVAMSEKQREARRDPVDSSSAVAAAAPKPRQIESPEVLDNGR